MSSDPQNSIGNPELGPVNSVRPVVNSSITTSGEIKFNQPATTIEGPRKVIETGKIIPIEVYRQRADEALLKKAA